MGACGFGGQVSCFNIYEWYLLDFQCVCSLETAELRTHELHLCSSAAKVVSLLLLVNPLSSWSSQLALAQAWFLFFFSPLGKLS
jgi:hypothetical protein